MKKQGRNFVTAHEKQTHKMKKSKQKYQYSLFIFSNVILASLLSENVKYARMVKTCVGKEDRNAIKCAIPLISLPGQDKKFR